VDSGRHDGNERQEWHEATTGNAMALAATCRFPMAVLIFSTIVAIG
jgi:hypothetical protein